jgi:predicted nucleic acid-binding Zn ribbon protein
MPIYVYRNLTTGETFEIEQRIIEAAFTEHPETGDPVKRLIQPVGIAFKGSGFYVTDSRSSNGAAKGKGAGAADKGANGETKVSESTGPAKASEGSPGAMADGASKGASKDKGAASGPSGG